MPAYYSRPGPGNYFDDQAATGEKTIISKYINAPSGYIQQPRDWQNVKERLQRVYSKQTISTPNRDVKAASPSRSLEKQSDIAWTRFYNYTDEQTTKKLQMLYPNTSQVTKNQNRLYFGKSDRKMPFQVKPEHATRCQHQ